tara:strand:- start:10020 stop:10643 length:624 start_codon:yes stop_codon:yes gene_type:complete
MDRLLLVQEAIIKAKAVLEDSQFARLHDSEGEEAKVKRPPKNPKEEKIKMPKDANKEMIKEDNPFLDAEKDSDSASRKEQLQERLEKVLEEIEKYNSMKDGKSLGSYRRLLSERTRLESAIENINEEIHKSIVIKGLSTLKHMLTTSNDNIVKSPEMAEAIRSAYEELEELADTLNADPKFADEYEKLAKPVLEFLKNNKDMSSSEL